jgi:hypothetical protein
MQQISFKITNEQYCDIMEKMEKFGLTKSEVIRGFIDRGLSK